jgi:hypothetical protein
VRFARLPHDALAELAAQLCAEGGAAAAAQAEAVLAAHQPVPQWAVEGVLLSSDLVPHVLAPLESEDGAAAAACSAWAAGWRATAEGRRRLKQVPFSFPQELLGGYSNLQLAVIPGDEERLVVSDIFFQQTRVLDRSMAMIDELQSSDVHAADEQSLFTVDDRLRRLSHDGTELATYEEEGGRVLACPVLAPGGLLFCVTYDEEDTEQDEIVALDAQTLQLRSRFGRSLLNSACQMAVVGDELFVCDCNNDRLQVFSLAGEHRRSITGEWKKPVWLCFAKDRLHLVEQEGEGEGVGEGEGEGDGRPPYGRRIFVLSLQGETLQVYTHPEGHTFGRMCCFDGKLLAPTLDSCGARTMAAFRGL